MGFREMEAFNEALLAKQLWRIMKNESSLVARILKKKYYPNCHVLEASPGLHPSITWHSIIGAKSLVFCGSRWLVGNETSLNIWHSRWLPRLHTFQPITPYRDIPNISKVSNLINVEQGCWREYLIENMFLLGGDELIFTIPLSLTWPDDHLIWHYFNDGNFIVRLAYHLKISQRTLNAGGSSSCKSSVWKIIWTLEIPPRIRVFSWCLCHEILLTRFNIAKRIPQPI